jgi:hypothetical protein
LGPLAKATLGVAKTGKFVVVTSIALEGVLGTIRAYQGVKNFQDGKVSEAFGNFGEAILRLLGLSWSAISFLKRQKSIPKSTAKPETPASPAKPISEPPSGPEIGIPPSPERGGAAPNLGGTAPMSGATIPPQGGKQPGGKPSNDLPGPAPVRTPEPARVGDPNTPPSRQTTTEASPPTGSGSPAPNSPTLPKFGQLPEGNWKPTSGTPTTGKTDRGQTFVSGHGNTTVPQSAYSGNGGPKIPGITSVNFHHPEAQMAYFMRMNPNIKEATIWINHPTGPGCNRVSGVKMGKMHMAWKASLTPSSCKLHRKISPL